MDKNERIAELLSYFDPVEIDERYQEVNGQQVTKEAYLKLYDPETGLLIASLPLHGKITDEELDAQTSEFMSRRAALTSVT